MTLSTPSNAEPATTEPTQSHDEECALLTKVLLQGPADDAATELSRSDANESGPLKEVRLQLPVRVHVQLHKIKLMRGQAIRDSVIAAMAAFFARHPVSDPAADPLSV